MPGLSWAMSPEMMPQLVVEQRYIANDKGGVAASRLSILASLPHRLRFRQANQATTYLQQHESSVW